MDLELGSLPSQKRNPIPTPEVAVEGDGALQWGLLELPEGGHPAQAAVVQKRVRARGKQLSTGVTTQLEHGPSLL